jgi:sugar transport system substrate-binding protein
MNKIKTLVASVSLGFFLSGVAPVQASDTVIASIVFQQDQFFRTIQKGMDVVAKESGITLLQGNSDSKPGKEISLIDTYIARGVDAIVISPVSKVASIPALERAHKKGIKVITYNSTVEADFPVSYLNSSQKRLGMSTGKLASEFIQKKLAGSANVGVLGFKSLLPEISFDRTNSFIETIKIDNNINVVSQQDAWLAEKAIQVAGDMITANPNMNVIYAANEGGTVGAVQAVRNAGKQGKIFVFGIDGTMQLIDFIMAEDNVLQAVTAQQPFVMGKMAIENAIASIEGKKVAKTVVVPVLGLSRTEPEVVIQFKQSLINK